MADCNRRRFLALTAGACASLAPLRAFPADSDAHAMLGKPVPAFDVPDTQGRRRSLAGFRGRPIVLEWSSPSCPFVRAQYQSGVMPEVQRWAASQGAVWLTVLSAHPSRRDYLPPAKAGAFVKTRKGAPTAILLDAEGTMGRAYDAVVTPHTFVVAPNGTLAYAGGPTDTPTMDANKVRVSRSLVRAALEDLAAGRKVAVPATRPFGCVIAYRG